MHTYIKSKLEPRLWTVGIILPGGWEPMRDCTSEEEAQRLVNYLNGGHANSANVLQNAVLFDTLRLIKEHEGALIKEYQTWCALEGKPFKSADEHYHQAIGNDAYTDEQRIWLKKFCQRWEFWEKMDRMAREVQFPW